MDLENAKAQMRKGVLEMCVLAVIAEGETYPPEIMKKLKWTDLIVKEGTLYPLLIRLKNDGLVDYIWREGVTLPRPSRGDSFWPNSRRAGSNWWIPSIKRWKAPPRRTRRKRAENAKAKRRPNRSTSNPIRPTPDLRFPEPSQLSQPT